MNKFLLIATLTFSSIFSSIQSTEEMPEPYKSLNVLPFDGQGWFGNARQLTEILDSNNISTVIEVGSWLGSSTRFLASSIDPKGKVYAVDTWKGSTTEAIHMQDPRLPYLYQIFLSNVIHASMTNQIVPIRMESLEAANALSVKADLIYIDASHETLAVYQDILAWMPHLNKDGVICGDDWQWATVQKGVTRAAKKLNLQVTSSENFWRLN